MKELETFSSFVKSYLFEYKSVSLARLGHFSKLPVSAMIHPVLNEFHPPSATINFLNDLNCSTSVAFLNFVADANSMSEAEARNLSEQFSDKINEILQISNFCEIDGFGVFRRNFDFSVVFQPIEFVLEDKASFGLPVFTLPHKNIVQSSDTVEPKETIMPADSQVENKHETVESSAEPKDTEKSSQPVETVSETSDATVHEPVKQTIIEDSLSKQHKKRKKGAVVWVILIILVAGGATALYLTNYWKVLYQKGMELAGMSTENQQHSSAQNLPDRQPETESTIPEIDNTPVETTVPETTVSQPIAPTTSAPHKYFIVADCFSDKTLAENRMKALQEQGYQSTIAGQTKQGLHIVTYGGYSDRTEAEAQLQHIRSTVNKHSWLYTK